MRNFLKREGRLPYNVQSHLETTNDPHVVIVTFKYSLYTLLSTNRKKKVHFISRES